MQDIYKTEEHSPYVVQGKQTVIFPDIITIRDNHNNTLGTIKATFDFKDMPNEFHAYALQMINSFGRRTTFNFVGDSSENSKPVEPKENNFWNKLLNFLCS